jgi:YihY family inner membrane protein
MKRAMSNEPENNAGVSSQTRSSSGATSSTARLSEPASLNDRGTADLNSTPLRPGAAAKQMLEADDAQHESEFEPASYSLLGRLRRYGGPALRYLFNTEVHTYAFSVAANTILSFFPFIVLLLTATRRLFHSADVYNIVIELVRQYLPSNQDFVIRNLQFLASVKGRGQALSFVMLLITSTGVFLPLEVALNSVWGFKKNRSYLMNGIVALGLALACGILALLSAAATAKNLQYLGLLTANDTIVFRGAELLLLKIAGIGTGIVVYFLIYWLLPNGRVPVSAVLPAAIIMGLLTEAARYIYVRALPLLDFQEVYGPFAVSVTLMFWAYISGMLLLLGAYLSAAKHSDRMQAGQ